MLDCEVTPSTQAFYAFVPSAVLNNSVVSSRNLAEPNTFLGVTF